MNFADTFQQQVTIIGAGTMGASITELFVMHGWSVNIFDSSEDQLKYVKAGIESTQGATNAQLVNPVTDLASLDVGGFVIECVPEDIDLKLAVLSNVEQVLSPELLTTNTSSLGISDMQAGLEHPEKFMGLHFFQPVPETLLVEVVHSAQTSHKTLQRGIECTELLQRKPIVVKDSAGFATSRLAVALGLEAMRMVEEGVASAEDIDAGMRLGYGHETGPLRMTDKIGLDVRLAISEHLAKKLGSRFKPPRILRRMVAEGKLGRKTGQGFFHWDSEQR